MVIFDCLAVFFSIAVMIWLAIYFCIGMRHYIAIDFFCISFLLTVMNLFYFDTLSYSHRYNIYSILSYRF